MAGDALRQMGRDYGIMENLTMDGSKEQTAKGSLFMQMTKKNDGMVIRLVLSIFLSIWFQVMASFLESLYMSDQGGECCTFLRTVSLISRTVVVRISSMALQSVSILSGLGAVRKHVL